MDKMRVQCRRDEARRWLALKKRSQSNRRIGEVFAAVVVIALAEAVHRIADSRSVVSQLGLSAAATVALPVAVYDSEGRRSTVS